MCAAGGHVARGGACFSFPECIVALKVVIDIQGDEATELSNSFFDLVEAQYI